MVTPTKNSSSKNNYKNNSLSQFPETIRSYLDEPKPHRKRESEIQALLELKGTFSDEDIADCLAEVRLNGTLGGEPCHSPLAYLATAMSEVLVRVREGQEKQRRKVEADAQVVAVRNRVEAEQERECLEWAERERRFVAEFPSPEEQREVIASLCRGLKFFATQGQAARTFAIGAWAQGIDFGVQFAVMG